MDRLTASGPSSSRLARIGTLCTTVVLGAALVGVGLSSYLWAQRSSRAMSEASAPDLMLAVQSTLRAAGSTERPALELALGRFRDRGLRYVAVLGPTGPRASAGSTANPAPIPPRPPSKRPPPLDPHGLPPGKLGPPAFLGPPPGPGSGPPVELLPDGRVRFVAPLLFAPEGPSPEETPEPPPLILIELEPLMAQAMMQRATLTLLVGALATVALLVVSLVFWRISRQAEASALQLERDRQLKLLGQMSAVLGHELRNPLTALKGHAQLLLEKLPEEHPGRGGAERVVREAVRLESLASQVLELARSGQVQPRLADPMAVARAAVETAELEGVGLRGEGAPASWTLDAERIEQVLVNLLRNARLASPGGEPIELVVSSAGDRLRFQVLDRGEGLPPGEEERIFEPFFTRRTQGTGLGLAVARQIVLGHGGQLSAANRPDGGASFSVSLPRGASPLTGRLSRQEA